MLLMATSFASAQSMADLMNGRANVTFIGLDFSGARFVPAIEFAEVDANPGLTLLKWNNLLEQEPQKFDMGKALDISHATNNTSFVRDVNEGLTSSDLLAPDPYELDPAKIPAMVKVYKTSGEGVAEEQPELKAGEAFRYSQAATLRTVSGSMRGALHMVTASGESFEAQIPEFSLHLPGAGRVVN